MLFFTFLASVPSKKILLLGEDIISSWPSSTEGLPFSILKASVISLYLDLSIILLSLLLCLFWDIALIPGDNVFKGAPITPPIKNVSKASPTIFTNASSSPVTKASSIF